LKWVVKYPDPRRGFERDTPGSASRRMAWLLLYGFNKPELPGRPE
jgi:hypothetical protein